MIRQWCEEHNGTHHNVHQITTHPIFGEPRDVCRDCLKEMLADGTRVYMASPYRPKGWIALSKPEDIPPFC